MVTCVNCEVEEVVDGVKFPTLDQLSSMPPINVMVLM